MQYIFAVIYETFCILFGNDVFLKEYTGSFPRGRRPFLQLPGLQYEIDEQDVEDELGEEITVSYWLSRYIVSNLNCVECP